MGRRTQRWFRVCAAIVSAAVASSVFAADRPGTEPDRREATASRTIFDCVAVLEKRGGGWCELAGASIADVFPRNLTPVQSMTKGPSTVIDGWNGAAYDPDRMILYFHGGGIGDYGGNEVYSFALKTGTWRRLTDPAPCEMATATSPSAAHTHDGFVHSRATQTLWLFPSFHACERVSSPRAEFWEFNPSREETRNGLKPLSWRRHSVPPDRAGGAYFRTFSYPDGRLNVAHATASYLFDPVSPGWKKLAESEIRGSGSTIYDPVRKRIWTITGDGLFLAAENGPAKQVSALGPGLNRASGIALAGDGRPVFWNGGAPVLQFDPDKIEWRFFDGAADAPPFAASPIFSKWVAVPQLGVFVGYGEYRQGVWVYRLPDSSAGQKVNTWPIQALLDIARPGATVTIPPGIYTAGAVVRTPMTLKLNGVRVVGDTAVRSVLLVRNARGPVVIEDFVSRDPVRCGNCAGIKVEGRDFDVTVRRARISNAEMGILTDNRGGRLSVEESIIEDIGHDRGNQPQHLIYAGLIDRVSVRRSILRRSHHLGHILKSRARITEVRDSYLLGLESRNSREADFPCGGRILFDNVVVQKGSASDNNDSFSMATEPHICGPHKENAFVFRNGWMVFDRPGGIMGTWKLKASATVRFSRNRFVGPFSWADFPRVEDGNKYFPSPSEAGLAPGHLPEISGFSLR